jgi:hypothetical protein
LPFGERAIDAFEAFGQHQIGSARVAQRRLLPVLAHSIGCEPLGGSLRSPHRHAFGQVAAGPGSGVAVVVRQQNCINALDAAGFFQTFRVAGRVDEQGMLTGEEGVTKRRIRRAQDAGGDLEPAAADLLGLTAGHPRHAGQCQHAQHNARAARSHDNDPPTHSSQSAAGP